jgi:catechol 2,3-dioxygenase-like lactoylglutathione lyase family enzyme
MKLVPIIKCRDLARSIAFYTEVLDFQLADPSDTSPVRDLVHGDAALQLTSLAGDSVFNIAVNVDVPDVDAVFRTYVARGLDQSGYVTSPVHQSPVDQSWGMRELYVTDPDGNTLRFRTPLP